MPAENGLPQYVSKHPKTGLYRYFRRPPKGCVGSVFTRSFGTKDKRVVWHSWPKVHAEAESYFARLISGRTMDDAEINAAARGVLLVSFAPERKHGVIPTATDLRRDWDGLLKERLPEFSTASPADLNAVYERAAALRQQHEAGYIDHMRDGLDQHTAVLRKIAPEQQTKSAFTLRDAYDQAWQPSKTRDRNSEVEISRYVDEFEVLNGKRDLAEYDRSHWSAWHKDCLAKHGPGPTAFKRFSMMKTVVNEAIRQGLFDRKNFAGQDVSMRKPKRSKLRTEGWLQDELNEWFSAPIFQGVKNGPHPDADYWVAIIIAYTGATMIEVTHMKTADVAERHGFWTFYFWRKKSDNSQRIIPIPKQILDLGFLDYWRTRLKTGDLFEGISNKLMTQTYSRLRADVGIARKGADMHAYRHHIKTLLPDLGCPDRVSDYITGHAPPNVGRTYGKTEFSTARRYMDKIDLGVKIRKWKP